jgi:hypothetical protein
MLHMTRRESYIGFEAPDLKPEVERIAAIEDTSIAKIMRLAVIHFLEAYEKEGDKLIRSLRASKRSVGRQKSSTRQ